MPLLDPLLTFLCPPLRRLAGAFEDVEGTAVFFWTEFIAEFAANDGIVCLSNMENLFGTAACLWLLPVLELIEDSDVDPNESDSGMPRADSTGAALWLLAWAPFCRCVLKW